MMTRRNCCLTLAAALVGVSGLPRIAAAAAPPMSLPVPPGAKVTPDALLTLSPTDSAGTWDFSRYAELTVRVRNAGQRPATVWARAENPSAKGAQDTVRAPLVLEPGRAGMLRLRLTRRAEDPTYAPFKPFFMYFKDLNVRDNTIDPAAVVRVVVWVEASESGADAAVGVESIAAAGEGVPGPVPFFPFTDRYGQYVHADWPGKIYADADFAARRREEEAEMRAYPGPVDWNKWGGWKDGPKQEATGYFYPKKVGEKWWLVDPDGCLFWSYGPTGVGFGEGSPVTGRENWFADLPPAEGATGRYWGAGRNARFMYYQGKQYRSFDFSGLNAERKYGRDWEKATAGFMHRRLRNWGFNTIGNWSSNAVMMLRRTPYTVAIHYGGPQLEHIPDVFDPAWERALNERMERERGTTAGDPWNLGYFVDNEWAWGYQTRAAMVAHGALKAAPTSASKRVFVDDLKAKYGAIEKLNAVWGNSYASWEALLESRTLPDTKNPKVTEDCGDFGLKFAEKYFSTARAAVKRVAPNNLYLGCRFHGHIDVAVVQAAARYCDVISYNIYEDPNGRVNQYRGKVDKPFLVGEFGVGSDLGQTPWRGSTYSHDTEEQTRALTNWFGKAIMHPMLVGAHFFQFRDQPLTGRGDGEATLRGFVNTADTPHFALVQTNRRIAYDLYSRRAGVDAAEMSKEAKR